MAAAELSLISISSHLVVKSHLLQQAAATTARVAAAGACT